MTSVTSQPIDRQVVSSVPPNGELNQFCDEATKKVNLLIRPLLEEIETFRRELGDLISSTDTAKERFPRREITVASYEELGHKWAKLIDKFNQIRKSYTSISGTFNPNSSDIIHLTQKFNQIKKTYQNQGLQHSWRGLIHNYKSQSEGGGILSYYCNKAVRVFTTNEQISELTLLKFPPEGDTTSNSDQVDLEDPSEDLQGIQTSEVLSPTSQVMPEQANLEASVGEE